MPPQAQARFDATPIQRELARQSRVVRDLAEVAGYDVESLRSMLNRAKRCDSHRRGLSWYQADRLACALGFHPIELWGDEWLTPAPGDALGDGWDEVERSWRQWSAQQDRLVVGSGEHARGLDEELLSGRADLGIVHGRREIGLLDVALVVADEQPDCERHSCTQAQLHQSVSVGTEHPTRVLESLGAGVGHASDSTGGL